MEKSLQNSHGSNANNSPIAATAATKNSVYHRAVICDFCEEISRTAQRWYVNPNSPICRLSERTKKVFQTSVSKGNDNQSQKITFVGFTSVSKTAKNPILHSYFLKFYGIFDDRP